MDANTHYLLTDDVSGQQCKESDSNTTKKHSNLTNGSLQSDWPSYQDVPNKTSNNTENQPQDHFVTCDGIEYAGTHLILDFWGAKNLDNLPYVEQALRKAVAAANATLLHIHLHHFSDSNGISGVAVLAESHISIHTWPERDYVAFDVFMCGDAKPEKTIPVLKATFKPEKINISKHLRGIVDNEL